MKVAEMIEAVLREKKDWEEIKEDIQGDLIRLGFEVKAEYPTLETALPKSDVEHGAMGFCRGWIRRSVEMLLDQDAMSDVEDMS